MFFAAPANGGMNDALERAIFRSRAFRESGIAWSCDPAEDGSESPFFQGDALGYLNDGWDLMIRSPALQCIWPSRRALVQDKREEQQQALDFVRALKWFAPY